MPFKCHFLIFLHIPILRCSLNFDSELSFNFWFNISFELICWNALATSIQKFPVQFNLHMFFKFRFLFPFKFQLNMIFKLRFWNALQTSMFKLSLQIEIKMSCKLRFQFLLYFCFKHVLYISIFNFQSTCEPTFAYKT